MATPDTDAGAGRPAGVRGDPAAVHAALTDAVAVAATRLADPPRPTSDLLAQHLYERWYARQHGQVHPPPGFPPSLVEVLRAADVRAAEWETGWVCDRVHVDGRAIARRGHEVRMLDRCDHLHATHPGAEVRAGAPLLVAGRRESVAHADGWWRAAARCWRFTRPPARLLRVFLHLDVAALPLLVEQVTHRLDGPAAGVEGGVDDGPAWQLKVAVDPALHARADAAVLYLDAEQLTPAAHDGATAGPAAAAVTALIQDLAPHGRDPVPPLTRRVAPGIAVAVDPGGDESFGSHRCRLLAEALHGWHPTDGTEAALQRIATRCDADDIELRHPERRRSDPVLPWP